MNGSTAADRGFWDEDTVKVDLDDSIINVATTRYGIESSLRISVYNRAAYLAGQDIGCSNPLGVTHYQAMECVLALKTLEGRK